MPEYIGNIAIPEITAVGTFPFISDYPAERTRDWSVAVHEMDNYAANYKIEQRFLVGSGTWRHRFQRTDLSFTEAAALKTFYEDRKGAYTPFDYPVPDDDGNGTTNAVCRFANEPLILTEAGPHRWAATCWLIEQAGEGPSYTTSSTVERFPSGSASTALLDQVQELVPLITITPKEDGYPVIYLSDRRVTVDGQLYQPRLLGFPSGISQGIDEASDNARFRFGNGDRVIRDLAYDTPLYKAGVQFSLLHVGTLIRIDVWSGNVVRLSGINKNEAEIEVTDSMPLNEMYPRRLIDRNCWKTYNDGINCNPPTFTDIDFPEADTATCDHTWDGPNGCRAHDNDRQFGGILAEPQGVRVKDNSTGTWGLGRQLITPTSIINDSIFGEVLPEIYTDVPMKINARVCSGRDEGDFYNALGIVGAGPLGGISENAIEHSLDGAIPHGNGPAGTVYGFRLSNGPDPAAEGEDVFPPDSDHWFQMTEVSAVGANPKFAAGVAFVEIRRADEKGLQLSRPAEHEMQVTVNGGVGGYTWDTTNGRLDALLLSNPVWIAVNVYLRSRAMANASAVAQEALFDVDQAIAEAAVCNDVVAALVGAGTETQWKFCGILNEQRPLRDWLQDILTTCLGNYYFQNGKLRIRLRYNSSSIPFTAGNIVRGSLELEHREPQFNSLTAEFADAEFEFAKNTVSYRDEDHVATYGLRQARVNLPGCINKSQALRHVATRVREEIGGITAADWSKNLSIKLKTTILALGTDGGTSFITEPGQVVSLTHPEMPGGTGEFRIRRWTLRDDFSIDIEGETTVDSMYDLTIGPKPADIEPSPLPVERWETILPVQPWFPHREQPHTDDPITDPTDWNFSIGVDYTGGSPKLVLTGEFPETDVLGLEFDPPRVGTYATSPSGGTIPNGSYVTVCLVATDADGRPTRPSKAFALLVGDTGNAHSIELSDITWPADTTGYRIYAGTNRARLSLQAEGPQPDPSTDPITLTSIANVRTRGLPQPNLAGLIPRAKISHHSGVVGLAVTEITENTLTFPGIGWTTNEWQGRRAQVISRDAGGNVPFLYFDITGNASESLTVSPDPVAAGIGVGDEIIILAACESSDDTSITDSKWQNTQYPGGFNTDEEIGRVVRITHGTGAGQERVIVNNNQTKLWIEKPWDTNPDTTSLFVVEDSAWAYAADVQRVDQRTDQLLIMTVPVDNLKDRQLVVEVGAIDKRGRESDRNANPRRTVYIEPTLISDWEARAKLLEDPLVVGTGSLDHDYRVQMDGTNIVVELIDCTANALTVPSGGNFEADITYSRDEGATWTVLCTVTIADGDKTSALVTDFSTPQLNHLDLLQVDIVSTGSALGVEIVLRGRKIELIPVQGNLNNGGEMAGGGGFSVIL